MSKEIKVGEYVRTRYGEIGIITENYPRLKCKKNATIIEFNEITKHSPNIIDLIEVGDIVRVLDNGYNRKIDLRDEDILQSFKEDLVLENWKLKSIVTKEQFKEMEYRV